jgi:hypothetical protein
MIDAAVQEQQNVFEGIHLCPICRKLFLQEKALYRHVVQAHDDGQYLSFNLHADLYQRWQDRIPKCRQ